MTQALLERPMTARFVIVAEGNDPLSDIMEENEKTAPGQGNSPSAPEAQPHIP